MAEGRRRNPLFPSVRTGDFPQEGEARTDDRKGFPYGGKTLRLGDKPPILFPL